MRAHIAEPTGSAVGAHVMMTTAPSDRPMSAQSRSIDWVTGRVTPCWQTGPSGDVVDRNSRFLLAKMIALRTKTQTTAKRWWRCCTQPGHTLTLDNGVEFRSQADRKQCRYQRCIFTDPYASWQRGRMKTLKHGQLRRFIPRSTDLANYSDRPLRRTCQKDA